MVEMILFAVAVTTIGVVSSKLLAQLVQPQTKLQPIKLDENQHKQEQRQAQRIRAQRQNRYPY